MKAAHESGEALPCLACSTLDDFEEIKALALAPQGPLASTRLLSER